MGEQDLGAPIVKRLDALTRLRIEEKSGTQSSKKGQGDFMRILRSAGLGPSEIATILGCSSSYVRSELSRKKR
jgi:hypothetical protein